MRIYYAHCQAIYNTPQEQRDIDMLTRLGFEVLDPSASHHIRQARASRPLGVPIKDKIMHYFCGLVSECEALAFRALSNGDIPAGVWKEVEHARDVLGIPVIELPGIAQRRVLDVQQTRIYLEEVGQR